MPLVVAHRGVWNARIHENTLAAFLRAIELGADMIEFDVRRARDGSLVIHHDESIGGLPIADNSFPVLRDAAGHAGFELARLEEVLSLTRGRIRLDVELKETGYESEVLQLLAATSDAAGLCVTSFHVSAIQALKSLNPAIRAGLLVEHADALDIAVAYEEARADFLAPRFDLLEVAAEIADGLFVWTVDRDEDMFAALRHPRVEAIITNRTDAAIQICIERQGC